ncbi:helix-turn-helix domain-containing protein [Sulfitobacter pontiacus]|uniref:helix-turn-helix domain-containing protein n=1 Tax=Sulfitobacter pontiacus TaxID=60137 RepID=UPI001FAE41AD|nr:helix-turn-helix domain-containing protein [Sulfitobacter pontiacus]
MPKVKTKRTLSDPDAPRSATKDRRSHDRLQDKKQERASRENSGFVQIYELGWNKMDRLVQLSPGAARFYMLLARNIDGTGAVVSTQDVLGQMLGVSTKTIQRHSKLLEQEKALVRIPLQGGIYAYALDPEQVWRAYDKQKEWAAFNTKTLVRAGGKGADIVRRKLQVMMRESDLLKAS